MPPATGSSARSPIHAVEHDRSRLVPDHDPVPLRGLGEHPVDRREVSFGNVQVRIEPEPHALGDGRDAGGERPAVGPLRRPGPVVGLGLDDRHREGVVDVAPFEVGKRDQAPDQRQPRRGGAQLSVLTGVIEIAGVLRDVVHLSAPARMPLSAGLVHQPEIPHPVGGGRTCRWSCSASVPAAALASGGMGTSSNACWRSGPQVSSVTCRVGS